MSLPGALQSFPSGPAYTSQVIDFNSVLQIGMFDWFGTGHVPPDSLYDTDGGAIQLGSGSAASADYIQGQMVGSTIRLNRLGKTFKFEWKVQLSSATLTQALIGVCITNTNLMASNITDGFGFYVNNIAAGAPGTGTWECFNAYGSAAQYSGYSQYAGPAADTSLHTFSIEVDTDASTTGAGRMTFWMDGVQVGNGFSSGSTQIFTSQLLRPSFAMGNGSAVAQTMNLDFIGWYDQV